MPTDPVEPLAAQLTQAILGAVTSGQREPFAVGVVTAVISGNATVSWNGGSYTPRRNSGYTPVVNDVVLMARPKDQLIILCSIV